jgi:CHAD domain-containing protein
MMDMSPTRHDEVERKYDVDPTMVLPNLAEAEGVGSVRPPEEFRLDAVYFDTAGLDLARRGVTLRRRSGGADAGWHLKLPVSGDTRTELQVPLGQAEETVPASLLTHVRAIVRDRLLGAVASVSTTRREYVLCGPDGAVLARVCDDRVRAQRLDDRSPEQSWREWEVELDGASPTLLDAVEAHLVAAGASPARVSSKFARTVGELASALPAPPSKDDLAGGTVGQLFVALLTEQTAKLQLRDAGVRAGQAGSIHRMRITARRLRSALTSFAPMLERAATDPVRAELRWLGESLGQARDAQVLREHLTGVLGQEPPELVVGSVAARIDDELSAAYKAGRERALEALESERYLRMLDALDELVRAAPLSPDADTAAEEGVRRLLRRDVKRLDREVRAITSAQDPEARDVAFHEARKKAKRLRYAAEAATPVVGKRARSLAASAKKVQEALGVRQDSVVARQRLREYGMQAHLDGDNAFTFGRLHALEQARADRATADFATAWSTFHKRQIPRWVG